MKILSPRGAAVALALLGLVVAGRAVPATYADGPRPTLPAVTQPIQPRAATPTPTPVPATAAVRTGAATTLSNAAEARVVASAYRTAITQPAVRDASAAEIRRQLRTVKPIAHVNGRWVTPIDMSRVYTLPTVRGALDANLRGTVAEGRLSDILRANPGARFGLAFTPDRLAGNVLGDVRVDILASLGGNITDVGGTAGKIGEQLEDSFIKLVVDFVIELGEKFVDWVMGLFDGDADLAIDDPDADPDGDGIPNKHDADDDGDGVNDEEDRYPYDPGASICSGCGPCPFGNCLGDGFVGFTNRFSTEMTAVVQSALRLNPQASLGAQAPAIQLAFASVTP